MSIKIKEATKKGYAEAENGDGIDISTRMETHRGTVQKGMIQTIKAQIDVGVCVNEDKTGGGLSLRKLTSIEVMRLMGGTDEMYYALRDIAKLSDAQIYFICGDGLIPQVVQRIMEELKP